MSPTEFETWFLSADLAKCDTDGIQIRVPNKYVAMWLKDNYYNVLYDSIKKTLNADLKVSFIYSDKPSCDTSISDSPSPTTPQRTPAPRLHSSCTFDDFITADFNRFARALAWHVANNPGARYNPLYIYSRASVGKTHLLNAIGNHILSLDPSARVHRISGDQFAPDLPVTRGPRSLSIPTDQCADLDLLLFDDIHLLATRPQSQKEFVSLYNRLMERNRQMVITAKEAPRHIGHLLPALQSRLESGVLCEIGTPDQEAKRKILLEKTVAKGIRLQEDVTLFLSSTAADLKALQNYLTTIEAHNSLSRKAMDLTTLKRLLKTRYSRDIGIADIQTLVSTYFNIPLADLISNKKRHLYSYPRQLAMYLSRKLTPSSLSDIGGAFGKRDHTTVIYALKRIENNCRDPESTVSDDLKRIRALLLG